MAKGTKLVVVMEKPVGQFASLQIYHHALEETKTLLADGIYGPCSGECFFGDAEELAFWFDDRYTFQFLPQIGTHGILYVEPRATKR